MGAIRKSKRDELLPTAVELHRQGKTNTQIAKGLNVSTKSITRWFKETDLEKPEESPAPEVEPMVHSMVYVTTEVFKGYRLQDMDRLEGFKEWRTALAIWQMLFGASYLRDKNMTPKEREETNTQLALTTEKYIQSGLPKAIEVGNTLFDVYFKGVNPNTYYRQKNVPEEDCKSFYEASQRDSEYIKGFFRNTFGAV
ncbi:hypothetical protein OAF75_00765 [Verrucomicrobiales bacterium]|nr:hypothetical protein [Verrucomicrobiales bacterium]